MPIDDFYYANDKTLEANGLVATISFNKEHAIFEGHFPEQPVVPGVCMIQIVKEMFEEAMSERLLLKEAAQIKFLQLVTPEKVLALTMAWKKHGGESFVDAVMTDGKAVFKMKAVFITIRQ